MRAALTKLGTELREALPPTLFFLLVFHLVAFLRSLSDESCSIMPRASTMATVGALILGKTILIVNKLRVTNWFSKGPLVYSILWKAMIFSLFTTMFQWVEELIPLVLKYGSVRAAADNVMAEIVWPRFWGNHLLLLIFLLIYGSAVELIRVVGAARLNYLFFGIGEPPHPGGTAKLRRGVPKGME